MGRANKKEKVPSSEEQNQDEESNCQEEEDEDGILAAHPEDDLDEAQRDEQLLGQIKEKAAGAGDEGEELTWNAIYALKKQEAELSLQLNAEVEAIRDRYELLKQPLFQQISQVALGNKVDSKLYRPEGLPCRGDPNKTAPKPIPDFWGVVFEKEGLVSNEVDVDCFSKVKELTCEILDHKTNHLRIRFKFSSPTNYFSNLELQVETKLDAEGTPTRVIKEEIKYKGERQEDSVFTMLFDSKTELHETYGFAGELYRDYTSALYFYFKEEAQGEEGEQGDEDDQQQEEEDDEEVQAVQKPKKKSKEQAKKQIEKPECKQQ